MTTIRNYSLTSTYRRPYLRFVPQGLLSLCLCCLYLLAGAQTAEPSRALTADEYTKAKTFQVADLDQDTYVKFENAYVLDRYEMKPPYVFKYSDGIERRIYLYRLLDNKTKASLGLVAIYTTPANGKKVNVVVPGATADKTVWAKYIDDLKELGAQETGFLSAFSFMLSREMSALLNSGATSGNTAVGAKVDYDVCFPENALVTLADGSERRILEVKAGTAIAAYNQQTGKMEKATVEAVQVHENKQYAITRVHLVREENLTATLADQPVAAHTYLEATHNHPVWTKAGRKELGQVQEGDILFCYDKATGEFQEFKVQHVEKGQRSVQKVYNLVTDKNNYVVNQTLVLDK